MFRIVLLHWNESEAKERKAQLEQRGHHVRRYSSGGPPVLKAVIRDTPDVFIVDLNRLPAMGRAVGVWLRQRSATREIPLVFIEGDEEKTERVRAQLPDAAYTRWSEIETTLASIKNAVLVSPVVPGTMDAYSKTPLQKKLGIRAGRSVTVLSAPEGFVDLLGELPRNVRLRRRGGKPSDIVLLFVRRRRDFKRRLPTAVKMLDKKARLWLLWPKKSSVVESDLDQRTIRTLGMDAGLVDYKISSIDETWSGLCFALKK